MKCLIISLIEGKYRVCVRNIDCTGEEVAVYTEPPNMEEITKLLDIYQPTRFIYLGKEIQL